MLKRLILLPFILASMLAPALVFAGPAEAAGNRTPGCITRAEFRAVKHGTSIARARVIIGAQGRTTSSASFGDGDVWRTIEFRQCNRSWSRSYVSMSFESTEQQVWVSYCQYGYYEGCESDGDYETQYVYPLILDSKSAYWS